MLPLYSLPSVHSHTGVLHKFFLVTSHLVQVVSSRSDSRRATAGLVLTRRDEIWIEITVSGPDCRMHASQKWAHRHPRGQAVDHHCSVTAATKLTRKQTAADNMMVHNIRWTYLSTIAAGPALHAEGDVRKVHMPQHLPTAHHEHTMTVPQLSDRRDSKRGIYFEERREDGT